MADTKPAKYRIRKAEEPRTEHNSLQLEIRANADSYITIVDVDSEGGVNVLFPNNYQNRTYYGDGFIRTDENVLIPDSIKPGNKAGFYWDYSPPQGTDTIRVFTCSNLQTANMIREHIQSLQVAGVQSGDSLKTRSITGVVQSLRKRFAAAAVRGIIQVADDTSHIPGTMTSADPAQDIPLAPDMAPTADLQHISPSPEMTASLNPGEVPDSALVASAPAQGDWTAASLTITISE